MTPIEIECAEQAVTMYKAGSSVKEIAVELESSRQKVLGWLAAADVKLKLSDGITWGR